MATYVHSMTSSGAETLSNQLIGTPVYTVGASGIVKAAFAASDSDTTATLKVRDTGQEIIPSGCHPGVEAAANGQSLDWQDFVFEASGLPSGANLDLEVVVGSAGQTKIAVIT